MNCLPHHSFEIETPLSVSEVVVAINAVTEPVDWFRWISLNGHKIFVGIASAERFTIRRIAYFQGSSIAIIQGSYRNEQHGTIVSIQMKLRPLALIFLYIGSCFMGIPFLVLAIGSITAVGDKRMFGAPLILLGALSFMWVLANQAFWFEVKETRSVLERILLGDSGLRRPLD